MSNKIYDVVFITHIPAFYKINLYNTLVNDCHIYVIFVASESEIRTDDFYSSDFNFDYTILHEGDFESRPKIKCLRQLKKTMNKINFKKIIVNGWDLLEFWYIVFTTGRNKNGIIMESSIFESKIKGWQALLKKIFISKISLAFPSGSSHLKLLKSIGYKGEYYITKGVGIFPLKPISHKQKIFQNRFLYVGRLSKEKNLQLLIDTFNKLPDSTLTIAGTGPQETELKKNADKNIIFSGHVDNSKIESIYLNNDVFVLPSISEPWGLVIDEALYYGLPVIVSNKVGCTTEIIRNGKTGLLFSPDKKNELLKAINTISQPEFYSYCRKNVLEIDFHKRDKEQSLQYINALKKDYL